MTKNPVDLPGLSGTGNAVLGTLPQGTAAAETGTPVEITSGKTGYVYTKKTKDGKVESYIIEDGGSIDIGGIGGITPGRFIGVAQEFPTPDHRSDLVRTYGMASMHKPKPEEQTYFIKKREADGRVTWRKAALRELTDSVHLYFSPITAVVNQFSRSLAEREEAVRQDRSSDWKG